jgi:glycine/D-amino acid oxidase-like deaminating enzyme/nitrite reductase/ring-hydroxylating ferredoxin subunit
MKSVDALSYPALDHNLSVDVLVIGAGITGLTAACLLARAGRNVAVVDKFAVGSGMTGHTTAHATYVTDSRLTELVSRFGEDHAAAAWQAGDMAIDVIRRNVEREEIDCQLQSVPGYLVASEEEVRRDGGKKLADETILARELGFDVTFVEADPLWHRPALLASNQSRFHPLRYLRGLARSLIAAGGKVFEHTPADEFDEKERAVRSGHHKIRFNQVIIATHNPIQGLASHATATLFQTKLAAYSTYAVGARVPRNALPDALFWDTSNPYDYVRIMEDEKGPVLIVGGSDHKTGQEENTAECYASLERKALSFCKEAIMESHWSGQVIETVDGLPYIGEIAEGQFLATGYAGNGMTFGTLAGLMFCEALTGMLSPWKELFDPHRKTLRASRDYLSENKDYPYYLIKSHLARPPHESTEDLAAGSGRIISVDRRKTAAYRNEDGQLTLLSPVCPHMGCVVSWNETERTWDCPCHGSRFAATGEVIAGPAESPLAAHEPKEDAPAPATAHS